MARILTLNWDTTTVQVSGASTPAGMFRVSIAGYPALTQDVAVSPAIIELPADFPAGARTAQVCAIDSAGEFRGSPLTINFTVPEVTTAYLVPINGSASVVAG
jgi:hypothetical protein